MILPILQSVLTLALVVAAFGFMAWRLWYFRVLVNTGTRPSEDLTDHPGERVGTVISLVLGHKKTFEDRWSGILHVCFLYGFMILAIGHVEVVLEGLTAFRQASGGRALQLPLDPRPGAAFPLPVEPGPPRRDRAGGRQRRARCAAGRGG